MIQLCWHLEKMTKNKFGELVFTEDDLIDLLMCGSEISAGLIVEDVSVINEQLDYVPEFASATDDELTVEQFDYANQSNWHMPKEYKRLDIAEYLLGLCSTDEQLQRIGHELLLYQEKNLFDLLRYLKYLVDTMKSNNIIWGVGRGSSVASYVLYLLEVHRIDSMYYDLNPEEFLR